MSYHQLAQRRPSAALIAIAFIYALAYGSVADAGRVALHHETNGLSTPRADLGTEPLSLDVDAIDMQHGIITARKRISVQSAGDLVLVCPEW